MSYNSAVECMIDNREAESSNLSRTTNFQRVCSSGGRASDLQSEGLRFRISPDPPILIRCVGELDIPHSAKVKALRGMSVRI